MTNIEKEIIAEISKDKSLGEKEISNIKKFINFLIKNKPGIDTNLEFKEKLKNDINLLVKVDNFYNRKDNNIFKNIIYLVSGFGVCAIGVFLLNQNGIITLNNLEKNSINTYISSDYEDFSDNSDDELLFSTMMTNDNSELGNNLEEINTLNQDLISDENPSINSRMLKMNSPEIKNSKLEQITSSDYIKNIIKNLELEETNKNIYENENYLLSINGEKFILILKDYLLNSENIDVQITNFINKNVSLDLIYQYNFNGIYYFSDGIRGEIDFENNKLLKIEKEF